MAEPTASPPENLWCVQYSPVRKGVKVSYTYYKFFDTEYPFMQFLRKSAWVELNGTAPDEYDRVVGIFKLVEGWWVALTHEIQEKIEVIGPA